MVRMAEYSSSSHHRSNSFDRVELGRELEENDKSMLDMETVSDDSSTSERVNVFVVFVFILEFLVLLFAVVLEYFIRFTDVFYIRTVLFSCKDPSISYDLNQGKSTYSNFEYYADIPFNVVVPLSFCIPPFLIVVAEIALWAFSDEPQKTIRVLCRMCKIPQIVRRMIRFIGIFLFGMFITMIFTDVVKLMVGRLRPSFVAICDPKELCYTSGSLYNDTVCRQSNKSQLRDARLSFPSLYASLTAFAATYMAIYMHNTIRAHGVRIMRPFVSLSFMMLAVLCSLSRYGLHYNHWEDILVGFLLGAALAIYVGVYCLNSFRESMSSRKLYSRLRHFLAEQRALELRDFYKEDRLDRYSYFGIPAYQPSVNTYNYSGAIPRPQTRDPRHAGHVHINGHAAESTTDPMEYDRRPKHAHRHQHQHHEPNKYRQHDTFQRDLHRTLDQYPRRDSDVSYHGHM